MTLRASCKSRTPDGVLCSTLENSSNFRTIRNLTLTPSFELTKCDDTWDSMSLCSTSTVRGHHGTTAQSTMCGTSLMQSSESSAGQCVSTCYDTPNTRRRRISCLSAHNAQLNMQSRSTACLCTVDSIANMA